MSLAEAFQEQLKQEPKPARLYFAYRNGKPGGCYNIDFLPTDQLDSSNWVRDPDPNWKSNVPLLKKSK